MLSLERATYRHAGTSSASLEDVTLQLSDGTLTGLLGASGAGLSTLCLVLSGLAPRVVGGQLRGTLRVDGADATLWPMHRLVERVVAGLGKPAAQLSMVAETVFEEVAFGPSNLGVSHVDVVSRTWSALEALSIADVATRDPRHLSGGEQQLVVLAGLLAMRPSHLVLDAPLAHLDPANRASVLDLLEAVVRTGTAVLVADHRGETFAEREREDGAGGWDARLSMSAGRLVGADPPAVDLASHGDLTAAVGGRVEAPEIVLDGVGHRYPSGVAALDGVDLVIGGGEAVAIVGANGSGKTTLAQHLDGLLRPTRGRVLIGGVDAATRSVADLATTVALSFQDPDRQVFARSVASEVGFGPRQQGRSASKRDMAVASALGAVGLGELGGAHPADIGESRRKLLAIASSLAMECPILVLDEPTAGLDDAGARIVERVVAAQRAQGRTVVAISHDRAFVSRSFDRVVRLEHGRVVADGRPRTVRYGRDLAAVPGR